MVAIDAQNWLTTKVTDQKNAKQIYGTKDGKYSLDEKDREFLTGDLVIENLNGLEELDLYDVRELNKVVIKNCPELRIINLLHSGVKQLEVGPGMDRIEELSIGFEISTDRPVARKLAKIDLSMVTKLKTLKCVGIQETELIGFEKLTQVELFYGNENVKIPTKVFNKWKENLDIITTLPNGLDLLKGGSGTDKDDVDLTKLDGYKNRPTKEQLDKEVQAEKDKWKGYVDPKTYRNDWIDPTNLEAEAKKIGMVTKEEYEKLQKEKEKIQKLHDAIVSGARRRLGSDWKGYLEITDYYNQIEQSNK